MAAVCAAFNPSTCLLLSGLPSGVSSSAVRRKFESYGTPILDVVVVRDKFTELSRGNHMSFTKQIIFTLKVFHLVF
jgi:hypothetical protein